jgi:DNA-binding LacI/PurR family transcriptional regulator
LKEAAASGVNIFQNIKLAGYDDIPMCKNTIPSLTSISTNYINIADQVISYFEKKNNNLHGHLYLVPVNLVKRKSTK